MGIPAVNCPAAERNSYADGMLLIAPSSAERLLGRGRSTGRSPFFFNASYSCRTVGFSRLACFKSSGFPKICSGQSWAATFSIFEYKDLICPSQGEIHIMGGHHDCDAAGRHTVNCLVDQSCMHGIQAAVGSSRITISGFITRISAMETCFFWPPESAWVGRSR